jgi:hypothetical protein
MDGLQNDATELEASVADAREGEGIFPDLGSLPPGTLITEEGLARLLGKGCRETIKRAVERGELPRPMKLMGKNTWTLGAIVRHLEKRLEAEERKFARLRP